ncbi:MAG: rod shape-determining protein MreC [Nitrosomonadaceae bacterium]|nr:rod shape-determining protein MreC [Nitrosomonadaceae bacterium]
METAPQFFRHGPGLLARLVFFALLSLLLMVIDTRFKYLPEIRQTIAVAIYPLQRLAHVPAAIYDQVSGLFVNRNPIDEIAHLRQQHLADQGQLQRLLALEAENAQLRNLLEAGQRAESKTTLAEILYIPHDPFSRKVILDKGSQNGIQPGQVVVDGAGVVGQITRVYPWLSEVTLITDKDHSVPVQLVRSGLRSMVSGTGEDGTLELRYLAANADIQHGDLLVTSGIDGIYPPGLPVALVSKIESNAAYAFARITCTPAAGVNRNRQVLILSPLPPIPERPVESVETKPEDKKRGKIGIR